MAGPIHALGWIRRALAVQGSAALDRALAQLDLLQVEASLLADGDGPRYVLTAKGHAAIHRSAA